VINLVQTDVPGVMVAVPWETPFTVTRTKLTATLSVTVPLIVCVASFVNGITGSRVKMGAMPSPLPVTGSDTGGAGDAATVTLPLELPFAIGEKAISKVQELPGPVAVSAAVQPFVVREKPGGGVITGTPVTAPVRLVMVNVTGVDVAPTFHTP
jgi:hypothetical protein